MGYSFNISVKARALKLFNQLICTRLDYIIAFALIIAKKYGKKDL
jgi:hypothetical protein|tara:strand:- start:21427 stop:21561 length:135 start_codon:yes stop_codon:yes gene_type:complete